MNWIIRERKKARVCKGQDGVGGRGAMKGMLMYLQLGEGMHVF